MDVTTVSFNKVEEERMNKLLKKVLLAGAITAAVIGGIWYATPSEAVSCSDIKIVHCGTMTHDSLKSAYNNAEIRGIYNHFGINQSMVNGAKMVEGVADASNNSVTVNGRVVAINAKTIQRKHVNYTKPIEYKQIGGKSYPSYFIRHSFMPVASKKPVFVWLDDSGKFVGAIIKDCGNPLWGEPTPPPVTPPKPQPPKPTPQPPVVTCDALTVQQVAGTRDKFAFTVSATAKNGGKIKDYLFNFGDGQHVTTANTKVEHTYAKAGTYTATVYVNTSDTSNLTSDKCKVTVTVTEEPKIQVCDLNTSTVVTIKESEFDKNKHSKDFADCEKVKVCDTKTGEIITVRKSEENKEGYSKNEEDCKVKVCDTKTKQIITVWKKEQSNEGYASVDSEACKPSTPVTPTPPAPQAPEAPELPRTGMTDALFSIFGLGTLAATTVAYIVSRRQ